MAVVETFQNVNPLDYLKSLDNEPGVQRMWEHFFNLARIPRSSFNEKAARQYVIEAAERRHLEYEVDSAGNVLVLMPGTETSGNIPGIVFQGHLDMRCVGEPDPAIYGVQPVISDGWVTAKGTSLGADNGIGLGAMLSLMDEKIPHGPLAFMFTVVEEEGLVGARNMDFQNKLKGYKYLVNIDHEPKIDGEAIISSAGAGDTFISLPVVYEKRDESEKLYKLNISGLLGGHSGLEIGDGRLNGLKVLAKILSQLQQNDKLPFNLVHLIGGKFRNAIPDEASAYISVQNNITLEQIQEEINKLSYAYLFEDESPDFESLRIEAVETKAGAANKMDNNSTKKVIEIINGLPNGIFRKSDKIPGHVEASSNIGKARTSGDSLDLALMSRSSSIEELIQKMEEIREYAAEFGAIVEQSEPYPGWTADSEAEINQIVYDVWLEMTGEEMIFRPIHAGLECGVIVDYFKQFQAISLGPVLLDAHTDGEKVNIDSSNKIYRLLVGIINKVTEKKGQPI